MEKQCLFNSFVVNRTNVTSLKDEMQIFKIFFTPRLSFLLLFESPTLSAPYYIFYYLVFDSEVNISPIISQLSTEIPKTLTMQLLNRMLTNSLDFRWNISIVKFLDTDNEEIFFSTFHIRFDSFAH